jgi:serine/threonine protein kinase
MAEDVSSSPIFAGRYRFQSVTKDWDRGRSGYTHLVFDVKRERLGVIKRAEINSQRTVENLKNEVAVLLDLKGRGVPEVYDTGETEYGSKTYFYVVIEYIDGIRVEKGLDALIAVERAEILAQFFAILARAHEMGIVNGDIDLKHLFWRRDRKQLIVIDWGNARLDVDHKKEDEFAYDLARSAEIIYALVTRRGRPATSGSLSLPKESMLLLGLAPLPREIYNLCKWAPRAPRMNMHSPYTAKELFDVVKSWQIGVPYKSIKQTNWILKLLLAASILAIIFFLVYPSSPIRNIIYSYIYTPTVSTTPTLIPSPTKETKPAVIILNTSTATKVIQSTSSLTPIPTTAIPPTFTPPVTTPQIYTNIIFSVDEDLANKKCLFTTESNILPMPVSPEGLTKRGDSIWQFKIESGRRPDQFIQTDFSSCLTKSQINAIALNAWIPRLDLQRKLSDSGTIQDGRQFGIFVEDNSGRRREYTIWMDIDEKMHLRVREDDNIIYDDIVFIVNEENLKIHGEFPHLFAIFPIQVFMEVNNQGQDIIYLKEGPPQENVSVNELLPENQMIIIDKATLPTIGAIKKAGLIGYGGETQALIWPLVFFGE